MMFAAWTTYDLATTRPLMGVVSDKTGRAGALAYLKNTSAPPDLHLKQCCGGREFVAIPRCAIVSRVSLCYIRWTGGDRQEQEHTGRATDCGQTF